MDNASILIGNVTRDPELRFTANGQPVCTFGLAVNKRWQNKQTQEWEEAVSFFNIVVWREQAEHVAESVQKGARVVAVGQLQQRTWEKEDATKGYTIELVADDVSVSLRWATAVVTRIQREGAGQFKPRDAKYTSNADVPAPPMDDEPFLFEAGVEVVPARLGSVRWAFGQ